MFDPLKKSLESKLYSDDGLCRKIKTKVQKYVREPSFQPDPVKDKIYMEENLADLLPNNSENSFFYDFLPEILEYLKINDPKPNTFREKLQEIINNKQINPLEPKNPIRNDNEEQKKEEADKSQNPEKIQKNIKNQPKNRYSILEESDFSVQIMINYPTDSKEFGFIKDELKSINYIIQEAVCNRLSEVQYTSGKGLFEFNFQDVIYINDSFGQWSFDVFFGIIQVFLLKKETQTNGKTFPLCWIMETNYPKKIQVEFVENKEKAERLDPRMEISLFFDYFSKKYNKAIEKDMLRNLKDKLIKNEVKDIKELKTVFDCSKNLFDESYAIKPYLIKELGSLSEQSVKNKKSQKEPKQQNEKSIEKEEKYEEDLIQLQASLHKVKLFFHSLSNDSKNVPPLINKKCLEGAHDFILKDFQNKSLMEEIKKFYFMLTERQSDVQGTKLDRGILFYGPPGTGKTTVASKFPNLIGLTPVCHPIASTELNRGLVGETEKLIIDICERAHLMEHLLCYLSIDEVEALVPRRDDKDNKGKGDYVNTFLSLIDGIKDVPNLVLIASTNYMKKIDEAFLRRMSGKYFVGRMDFYSRSRILEKVNRSLKLAEIKLDERLKEIVLHNEMNKNRPNLDVVTPDPNEWQEKITTEDCLQRLNQALINYTPAAVHRLCSEIIKHFCFNDRKPLSFGDLLKITMDVCRQMNIKVGSYILPLFFDFEGRNLNQWVGRIPTVTTGLVLVDFEKRCFRFKITQDKKRFCFSDVPFQSLRPGSSIGSILQDLAQFAFISEVDSFQIIDSQYLIDNAATDETKALEKINEVKDELTEYRSSMIVLDLDSIVCVSISESYSSEKSVSKSITNNKLFQFITDLANNLKEMKKTFWVFLICRDGFLQENLVKKLDIQKSKEEELEQKKREEEATKEKLCVRCKKTFMDKDNKSLDCCNYHLGYLYDSSLPKERWEIVDYYADPLFVESKTLRKKDPKEKKKKKKSKDNDLDDILKEFRGEEKKHEEENSDEDEEDEPQNDRNPFVYLCCRKFFGEYGCKNNKHSDNSESFKANREKVKEETLKGVLETLTNKINDGNKGKGGYFHLLKDI